MKNRFIETVVAGILLTATGMASAEPVALTDAQMDNVSAGALLGLDSVLSSTLTLVDGLLGSVVTTVDAILPQVSLQAGATATVGAGLAISL
jgi:translation initiation factor 2 gamma subunit (eIF-2gamma)